MLLWGGRERGSGTPQDLPQDYTVCSHRFQDGEDGRRGSLGVGIGPPHGDVPGAGGCSGLQLEERPEIEVYS